MRDLFNQIAVKYDYINSIMSLGLDRVWRKRLLGSIDSKSSLNILDVATGTGELAIKLVQGTKHNVMGIDIAEKMIEVGQKKILKLNLSERVQLSIGDVHQINFPDNSFDLVTIAFGIRNFEQLELAISEIYRVLKPCGEFRILELTIPTNKIIYALYRIYVALFLLPMSSLLSNNKTAYLHLQKSINDFPSRKRLLLFFETAGFVKLNYKSDYLGVVTYYSGCKSLVSS
jgi:demethylmenaquinone methyltransferase / 2-methoxy-6-polyprenyl-1,4-benzoquinol methylase